ncbi:putative U1 zinc finger containing protein [Leishmania naiffi]|uniref:U1 zinc finger containing protein n=1 Tax=Leishmania naiffi TaxID=5678 RepID=A0AAW3BUE6_9TRYP
MDPSAVAAPREAADANQHHQHNRNGNGVFSAGQPSEAEMKRIRQRRRLARKTPEQRRRLQQYQRRHNEKDERLYYCDYCDLFISSRHRTWMTHLRSTRHMNAFQSYYDLVAHVESVWVAEMNCEVERARSREVHRLQKRTAGSGAATPLTAQQVAPGIVVGGTLTSGRLPPPPPFPQPSDVTVQVSATPAIRVGTKTILPPVVPAASPIEVKSSPSSPLTDAGSSRKSADEPRLSMP